VRSLQTICSLSCIATALAVSVAAQVPSDAAARRADDAAHVGLATITEQDFRTKLEALAHDSTLGRETPSPELEKAAEWVAAQFERAGLEPGGVAGTYYQPFTLRQSQLDTLTTVVASCAGTPVTWQYGTEFIYIIGGDPAPITDAPVVLLRGIPATTDGLFADMMLEGAVLVHTVPPDKVAGRFMNPIHEAASAAGAAAHVIITDMPDALWDRFRHRAFTERWELIGGTGQAEEPARMAVYGLQLAAGSALLEAAGDDPSTALDSTVSGVRLLERFTFTLNPHYTVQDEPTVANTVGILRGHDPNLRHEAVVFTSHMDHVGTTSGRCRTSRETPADTICNGADDNASGTVGIIEIAEAFAALPERPARTLIFAAMAAEERGLFGSYQYVKNPLVPIANTAAVVNLDMIARNPPDTVGFVGKDYSSLGAVVDRTLADYPELNLTPAAHEGIYWGSDHYPFARRGVPALFFFSGLHRDLHVATDNVDRADTDQATRIVKLAFLAGFDVANAASRPVWDKDARTRVMGAHE
jgi:hypothetical protein